ncbi:MFS transporter [Kitasatospora sp. NBC_01287]|uniref:MFS transporter n=1 Tax=Kitasatospora sp. NBC_01287 TaxID=2903573 RepID=UPI0022519931|nr:MFS transporter [Kitasatospora sp. NBC_01287]MCX4747035.1 MFS transporter [Kitasatospora sp. NBC_01287]
MPTPARGNAVRPQTTAPAGTEPRSAERAGAERAGAEPDTGHPRRWLALVAVALSVLVLGFDQTILNVALPTMATALHADTGQQQWLVDAYTLAFAALLLPAGLLGDRLGRRRLLTTGLGLFGAASTLGMFATGPGQLIAVRAAMGLAGAFVMPLSMAVIPGLFPVGERRKAVTILTASVAAGAPFGPLIGGLLLRHYWWGSVFLINLPLVAIGLVACLVLLPESKDPAAPRLDLLSALLGAAGLAALTYGIIEGPARGWSDPLVLVPLIGSLPALTALVLRSRRQAHPMLDLGLLTDPVYRWAGIAVFLVSLVMLGAFFILPIYFQGVLGSDALGTGVRMMPMMAGLVAAARLGEKLHHRLGSRALISLGLLLLAAALLVGSRTGDGDGFGFAACWTPFFGAGLGLSLIPASAAAMTHLPKDRAGVGSGLLQTLRQVGGAFGVAVFGSLLSGVYQGALHTDGLSGALAHTAGQSVLAADSIAAQLARPALAHAAHHAYVHGMDMVLIASGILAALSAVLVALRMPRQEPDGQPRSLEESPA